MSTSSSFLVSLLLLVLVVASFNSSTAIFVESLARPPIPPANHLSSMNSNETNDNSVLLTFQNDMPRGEPSAVYLYYNLEPKPMLLEPPGVFFMRYANLERQTGLVYWSFLCAIFYQYDPAVDGGHPKVYWSVTVDGVYHSWDNQNWDLKAQWRNDNCDRTHPIFTT